jgi:hypothetical protein
VETVEVTSYQHEDTKWNFWKLLLLKEDRWVKSETNSTDLGLVEVCLQAGFVKCSQSVQKLRVFWVWYLQLGFKGIISSLAIHSALEIKV